MYIYIYIYIYICIYTPPTLLPRLLPCCCFRCVIPLRGAIPQYVGIPPSITPPIEEVHPNNGGYTLLLRYTPRHGVIPSHHVYPYVIPPACVYTSVVGVHPPIIGIYLLKGVCVCVSWGVHPRTAVWALMLDSHSTVMIVSYVGRPPYSHSKLQISQHA